MPMPSTEHASISFLPSREKPQPLLLCPSSTWAQLRPCSHPCTKGMGRVTAATRVTIKPSLLQRAQLGIPASPAEINPAPTPWSPDRCTSWKGSTGSTNYPQFQPCWERKTFHKGFNKNPITFACKAHLYLGIWRFGFSFPWDTSTEHSHLSCYQTP